MPAKLLEVNRKAINSYRERTGQAKVSFTHLIATQLLGDRRCRSQHAKRVCGGRRWEASPHQGDIGQHGPRRRCRQGRRNEIARCARAS